VTWRYLHKNYEIQGNLDAGPHIDISLEPFYELPKLKRIVQATIYFQLLVENLGLDDDEKLGVARDRRRRSRLAEVNKIQHYAVAVVKAVDDIDTIEQLVDLTMRQPDLGDCWDYVPLLPAQLLQFRSPKSIPSPTAGDFFHLSDFVISFIYAALACPSSIYLQEIPANLEGLRYFLTGKRAPEGSATISRKHVQLPLQPTAIPRKFKFNRF
jgi:hypothetical protein